MIAAAHPLVHLNAALNALATMLLVVAWRQIRAGREQAHGRTMSAALVVSAAFLASYLTYHAIAGSVRFTHPGFVRFVYYAILITHVVLAAFVPLLAVRAAWLGMRAVGWAGAPPSAEESGRLRSQHRRIVRWALPIWLYVSVTGVAVYLMLYHIWPGEASAS
jgi:uncharacterized membrane protein YozB (DUF420 family)